MGNEVWKDIKGYEGLYQVSNLGNVRSLGMIKNCYTQGHQRGNVFIPKVKTKKSTDNGHGYLIVSLSNSKGRKNHYVHRLVAEAFLHKSHGKDYVNHLDYNRANNAVDNLEWCTQKGNVQHSKENYSKQHASKTSTGERYITMRKDKKLFRVCIKKANVDKSFKDFDSAITFRNEVLNAINYTV